MDYMSTPIERSLEKAVGLLAQYVEAKRIENRIATLTALFSTGDADARSELRLIAGLDALAKAPRIGLARDTESPPD